MATPIRTVHVLLVEDDDIDAEAVLIAFRDRRIANPVTVVTDGVYALEALRGNDQTPPFPRPYLILLDLNLPRMDGIEFLEVIRHDPQLKDSIVFVLTTSDDDRDKVAAYQRFVAGYIVKSRVGDDFIKVVEMLDTYWRVIEFPPRAT